MESSDLSELSEIGTDVRLGGLRKISNLLYALKPVKFKQLGHAGPLSRVFLETGADESLRLLRDLAEAAHVRLPVDDLVVDLLLGLADEGCRSRKQHVGDNTCCPNIHLVVIGYLLAQLWSHIQR